MEDIVIYIVIIAISGIISIANKAKENEQKKKKENTSSPKEYNPPELHEEIDCPFCGANNNRNSRFCLICGFDILNFSDEKEKQKEQKIKEEEKIKAKAELLSKREKEINELESGNFNKQKHYDSPLKIRTAEDKKEQTLKINIKQIFLYKELLDKPLAMRKKQ